jgi:hypothetical protein
MSYACIAVQSHLSSASKSPSCPTYTEPNTFRQLVNLKSICEKLGEMNVNPVWRIVEADGDLRSNMEIVVIEK